MQIKRRAITVGTTFFLAAATGHVMQNGETISARLRGGETAPVLASVQATAATVVPSTAAASATSAIASAGAQGELRLPELLIPVRAPAIDPLPGRPVLTASGLPDLPAIEPAVLGSGVDLAERVEALDVAAATGNSAADANYTVFGIACADPQLTLESGARAMLTATLSAPCFANERVTVIHEGLVFTLATDAAGDVEFTVPALSKVAAVKVRFSSGDEVAMSQVVTGLGSLNRVAVTWRGTEGLHLNAFENGSVFGGEGHVSQATPRDRATELGGFLVALGDATVDQPYLAEVYTAPVATSVDDIVVDVAVSEVNCGRLATGTMLDKRGDGDVVPTSLSFAMPGCDAIGGYVMLGLGPLPQMPVSLAANDG